MNLKIKGMKKTLVIAVAVIITGVIIAKSPSVDFNKDTVEGIQFHKASWKEALIKAKKENKLVFLDMYATWCGPCKKLKAYTFSSAEVGKYYNEKFINVALDAEKGEGVEIARKYGVRGYPTLLFIDSSGKVVAKTSGYHKVDKFLELGKKVQASLK